MSTLTARPRLALLASTELDIPGTDALAAQLGLPQLPAGFSPTTPSDYDALLIVSGDKLSLQQTRRAPATPVQNQRRRPGRGALPGPVAVDFGSEAMRHRRRSGHNELLGKAVGVAGRPHLHVLDATAGLGRDSFVLADMGCTVTLCEREPVIAALLEWGMRSALASTDPWLVQVLQHMTLLATDARSAVANSLRGVDVIYLDPMFPARDKSAAVKKEMALFQLLLDGAVAPRDAEELLHWALAQDVARVIVKRPLRAPPLAAVQPSHNLAGKAVRFDVYVLRGLG